MIGFGPSSIGRLDLHANLAVIHSDDRGDLIVPDTRWEVLSDAVRKHFAPTPVRLVWRLDGRHVVPR